MVLINEYDVFEIKHQFVIVNYLTGACDIINHEILNCICNLKFEQLSANDKQALMQRGYLFDDIVSYNRYIDEVND